MSFSPFFVKMLLKALFIITSFYNEAIPILLHGLTDSK